MQPHFTPFTVVAAAAAVVVVAVIVVIIIILGIMHCGTRMSLCF